MAVPGAALRHKVDWTGAELRRVRDMADKGVPTTLIAATIGRTVNSVQTKLNRMRRAGNGPRRQRTPLHGLDMTGAHPVVRKIIARAAYEGFTHRTLAERAGVARSVIFNMRKRRATFETIVALAGAVGLRLVAVLDDGTGGHADD